MAPEHLQVKCSFVADALGAALLRYRIKNTAVVTLHLFDSPRMPYLLLQADGSLLVLHGVNPPDPEREYFLIEIPITQPILPGEVIEHHVSLAPLVLKDHYKTQRTPPELHGRVKVHCQVGWGETPILASERHKISISMLLAWQHLVEAKVIQVDLP